MSSAPALVVRLCLLHGAASQLSGAQRGRVGCSSSLPRPAPGLSQLWGGGCFPPPRSLSVQSGFLFAFLVYLPFLKRCRLILSVATDWNGVGLVRLVLSLHGTELAPVLSTVYRPLCRLQPSLVLSTGSWFPACGSWACFLVTLVRFGLISYIWELSAASLGDLENSTVPGVPGAWPCKHTSLLRAPGAPVPTAAGNKSRPSCPQVDQCDGVAWLCVGLSLLPRPRLLPHPEALFPTQGPAAVRQRH